MWRRIGGWVSRLGVPKLVGAMVVLLAMVTSAGTAFGLFGGQLVGSAPPELTEHETGSELQDRGGGETTGSASTLGGAEVVVVHVAGCVLRPGVYSVPAAGRVVDAVQSAGGPSANAALSAVNLAAQLTDAVQVYIPSIEEVAGGWTQTSESAGAVAGGGTGTASAGGPVDINTAGVAELDTLPGIGQVTAGKIVADRAANGPFASLDDLGRVPGIGDAKVQALQGLAVAR